MTKQRKSTLIVFAVVIAITAVMIAKQFRDDTNSRATVETLDEVSVIGSGVPMLLELGSHGCTPCKAMMPILLELKAEYAGKMTVGFVDIIEDKTMQEKYQIRVMPTQIFFDGDGKELFRHEGFYAKEKIIGKWKELGFDFGAMQYP